MAGAVGGAATQNAETNAQNLQIEAFKAMLTQQGQWINMDQFFQTLDFNYEQLGATVTQQEKNRRNEM